MTKLLFIAERGQLAALLLGQAGDEPIAEEQAVGRRGLASWTESTRNEEWAEFYPPSLRDNGSITTLSHDRLFELEKALRHSLELEW